MYYCVQSSVNTIQQGLFLLCKNTEYKYHDSKNEIDFYNMSANLGLFYG